MNDPNTQTGSIKMNKLNSVFCNTVMAIVLSSTSFLASANRPAMEDEANTVQKAAQEKAQQTSSSVKHTMQQPTIQYQTTGDTLVLPPKEMQPGETINIKKFDTPRRGVTMETVRRQLGQPIATSASVGQPPITRWTYQDRIVYFEYSKVLHVVTR
jgi:hypothetical protein